MSGIYRYFAIASGFFVAAAMLGVSYIYYASSLDALVDLTERHNVALARTLADKVWSQVSDLPAVVEQQDNDALQNSSRTEEVDETLRVIAKDLAVLKVKLYSPQGITLYSSDPEELGQDRHDDSHPEIFANAAEKGMPQSKFSREDSLTAFSGEVFDRDVVETYVPILNADAETIGVFELYSDVTTTKQKIDSQITHMVVGSLIIFALLYGALVLIVMKRVVTPLQLASQKAAAIGPHTSGARVPTAEMPGEVLPLIEAINGALDRLDQALGAQRQFAADAAHELLTPLAVLRANLDTLGDKQEVSALRRDLEAMTNVVTQLLELTELEAWEDRKGEPVDPRQVCVEVISMLAPIAIEEGKTIELFGPEKEPPVRCCGSSLSRALRNLIENAVAHTAPDTPVEVHLGGDGSIQVIDHGPGVPFEMREKVFHRFWRGSDRARPGSGLGLSIVKRFAEAFGGSIVVSDAPGGGAVFTLRLPPFEGENP